MMMNNYGYGETTDHYDRVLRLEKDMETLKDIIKSKDDVIYQMILAVQSLGNISFGTFKNSMNANGILDIDNLLMNRQKKQDKEFINIFLENYTKEELETIKRYIKKDLI